MLDINLGIHFKDLKCYWILNRILQIRMLNIYNIPKSKFKLKWKCFETYKDYCEPARMPLVLSLKRIPLENLIVN